MLKCFAQLVLVFIAISLLVACSKESKKQTAIESTEISNNTNPDNDHDKKIILTAEEAIDKLHSIMSREIKDPLWLSDAEEEGQLYRITLFQEILNGSTRIIANFYVDRNTSDIYFDNESNGTSEKITSYKVPDSFISFEKGIFPAKEKGLCNSDEIVIYSFLTKKNNKIMSICSHENPQYYVYKYGTKNETELEFPKNKTNSESKFKYSYKESGNNLDLKYLSFDAGSYTYQVYWEYRKEIGKDEIGIKVINNKDKKEIKIEGDSGTIIGNLSYFKYSELNSDNN
jgi:hypothetical protein